MDTNNKNCKSTMGFSNELFNLSEAERLVKTNNLNSDPSTTNLCTQLHQLGFRSYGDEIRFIRDHVVYRLSVKELFLWLHDYLFDSFPSSHFFKEYKKPCLNHLSYLRPIDPEIDGWELKDTLDTHYTMYHNGVCITTASGARLMPYSSLTNSWVRAENILPRDYKPGISKLKEKYYQESDFYRFMKMVCTDPVNREFDAELMFCLRMSLAHLTHSHHNVHDIAATYFFEHSNVKEDGRTGKSTTMEAVCHMLTEKQFVVLNGKNYQPDNRFYFANVNDNTRLLFIDDAHDTENLMRTVFNALSSGYRPEKKNVNPDSYGLKIKTGITTNFPPTAQGGSHRDRRIDIPFKKFFSASHTPEHEFKSGSFKHSRLYDDWDDAEWDLFDSFMHSSLMQFFQKGFNRAKVCRYSGLSLTHKQIMLSKIDASIKEYLDNKYGASIRAKAEFQIDYHVDKLISPQFQTRGFNKQVSKWLGFYDYSHTSKQIRKEGKTMKVYQAIPDASQSHSRCFVPMCGATQTDKPNAKKCAS